MSISTRSIMNQPWNAERCKHGIDPRFCALCQNAVTNSSSRVRRPPARGRRARSSESADRALVIGALQARPGEWFAPAEIKGLTTVSKAVVWKLVEDVEGIERHPIEGKRY